MPGREFEGVVVNTESPVLGSLKAHKVLPHREASSDDSTDIRPARRRQSSPAPLKTQKAITSDRLRSWVRESSDIHTIPVIGKPLTPPINFRDNFKSWIDDEALRDREFLTTQQISPGATPLVAHSPPTPETTPPRQVHKSSIVDSLPVIRNVSDGRPPSSRHAPESRTDSFRTARENLSSDEESHPPDSPSLHASRQRWLRDAGLAKQRDVGLGLGLESDDDEPATPKEIDPPKAAEKDADFVAFNGVWDSNTQYDMEDTESQITAHRDSDKEEKQKPAGVLEVPHSDSPTLGIEARPLSKKETRVRRRAGQRKRSSREEGKEKAVEQDSRPLENNMNDSDAEFQEANDKRLSQASTTSTIVEAMIVESPPQRLQTLRHTGKMMRLGSFHNAQTHSTRSSLQSDDRCLKHQLRNASNPDQGLRKSFASEIAQTTPQRSTKSKGDSAPVVVIPDRRSSLQSSVDSGKRLSRTFSFNSRQQSSRPTTAPEDAVGYFDVPRRDRRTVSAVVQRATPCKLEKKVEKDTTLPADTDISPAAAAASRELSRTTSVTSGGMLTHYIPQTPTSQEEISPKTAEIHENKVLGLDRSSSGDWASSRPRSSLLTPFSLRSTHSSTPGTLEINEATAISIYPHTNKSILVIQETAGRDDASPREKSAVIAGNASIALPCALAPVIHQPVPPSPQREIMSSPLQNPREPPQPPDLRIIPATPANAASSSEDTVRNVKESRRNSRFSAPFSSLKRAVSARRYSESISNPFAFSRTLSMRSPNTHQRPHTTENRDSQLHPFWRPRAFWDDMDGSDSDSEFGNNGTLSPRRPSSHGTTARNSTPKRSTSLTRRFTGQLRSASQRRARRESFSSAFEYPNYGIKPYDEYNSTPKRTMSLTRRIGGSLRLPSARHPLLPRRSTTADWNNQPNYEFIHADDRQEDDMPPREGYPVQFIRFKGLAERIERRRSVREEGKREERRNWLKGRIGLVGPRDVSGFEMVHPAPRIVEGLR